MPQTIDGLTINITGAVAAGDSFRLQPFRAGASSIQLAVNDPRGLALGLSNASGDNRNGLAMAAIADAVVLQGLTFSQAFGEVSAKIGTTTRGLQSGRDVSAQLLQQAKADQSEVSGVNLDEEAAKLIRFQQAYQASAKVIATAQTVFQSLLELGR
jgi:flagellar hook-associated protein 1 FlgK